MPILVNLSIFAGNPRIALDFKLKIEIWLSWGTFAMPKLFISNNAINEKEGVVQGRRYSRNAEPCSSQCY